jgi:myo-inositol-1(or 4)-monophosphatase
VNEGLTRKDRRSVQRVLESIARDAAAELMLGFRRGARVEFKGPVDLVTEFDRRSEAVIRARVATELAGIALVAEEGGGAEGQGRPTLYADPLDGTTNFAHGHPVFSVSLGLIEPGIGPTIGVVYAPVLRWLWSGIVGEGAQRNGEAIAVSGCERLGEGLLATGFPYDRRTSDENNFKEFVAIERSVAQGVRRLGSAACDLCLVADGTYDGYWEKKLSPWDLAGGSAIVLAAGGAATGYDGAPVDVRSGAVVATNGHVHAALIEALAGAR